MVLTFAVITSSNGKKPLAFAFNEHAVRVVMRDGEPWWMASDVCSVLDIANVGNALSRLDADERDDIRSVDAIGRPCQVNITDESGLYSMVPISP